METATLPILQEESPIITGQYPNDQFSWAPEETEASQKFVRGGGEATLKNLSRDYTATKKAAEQVGELGKKVTPGVIGGAIGLHSLAVLAKLLPFKGFQDFTNNFSNWYSAWIPPALMLIKGLEFSLLKQPIRALVKFLAPATFLISKVLGANIPVIDISTINGFHSGTNLGYENLEELNPNLSKTETVGEHFSEFGKAVKLLYQRLTGKAGSGQERFIDWLSTIASTLMVSGTAGGLTALGEINSSRAKLFSIPRNTGGIGGDISLFFKNNKLLHWIGSVFIVGSVLNTICRWLPTEFARNAVSHLGRLCEDISNGAWIMRDQVTAIMDDMGKKIFGEDGVEKSKIAKVLFEHKPLISQLQDLFGIGSPVNDYEFAAAAA